MTGIRLSVFGLFLLAVGCGGGASAVQVEGNVTLNNSPLEKGEIMFMSSEGKTPVIVQISGGKYRGRVPAGKYKIQFSAMKEVKNTKHDPNTPGSTPMILVNQVPAKWAAESQETREVTASGSNKFDFDIK